MTGKWGGKYLLVVLLNLECAHPRKKKKSFSLGPYKTAFCPVSVAQ